MDRTILTTYNITFKAINKGVNPCSKPLRYGGICCSSPDIVIITDLRSGASSYANKNPIHFEYFLFKCSNVHKHPQK